MEEGLWTHADIVADRFTLDDLADALDYIETMAENRREAEHWRDLHAPR